MLTAFHEIVRILDFSGKKGWTKEDLRYFRNLVLFYLIWREEDPAFGPRIQNVNAHTLHTIADVQVERWGEPSNNACWGRERKVAHYLAVPTNGKNVAKTITDYEIMRETHQLFGLMYKSPFEDTLTFDIPHVRGENEAVAMINRAQCDPTIRAILNHSGGVLLGSLKKKNPLNDRNQFTKELLRDVQLQWPDHDVFPPAYKASRGKFCHALPCPHLHS